MYTIPKWLFRPIRRNSRSFPRYRVPRLWP